MPTQLTHFAVVGLHGVKSISAPLSDNRLVLVGENGSGKSTLANLIYFFLTRQWDRIAEYRFSSLEATVNGRDLTVKAEQVEQHTSESHLLHRIPRAYQRGLRHLSDLPASRIQQMLQSPESLRMFARDVDVPPSIAREVLNSYLHTEASEPILELNEFLKQNVSEQFLYLPTYRRIEHDLQAIFRKRDIDLDSIKESLGTRGSEAYVELVHFGMQDVEQKIERKLEQTRENLRTALSKLTGSYLRDIIQGQHDQVSVDDVVELDTATVEAILARIPDETLPSLYKDILKDRVAHLRGNFQQQDKVIAHFMLQLRHLYEEQQRSEIAVREFVDVCNRYFVDKKMVYDDKNQAISVRLDSAPAQEKNEVQLKMLSSGEKQIVSLFSHLYFSKESRYFVVIDEPELSLSVPWQRKFLPDILSSKRVDGLIAVTHSPFVYENSLEAYVKALPELTTEFTSSVPASTVHS